MLVTRSSQILSIYASHPYLHSFPTRRSSDLLDLIDRPHKAKTDGHKVERECHAQVLRELGPKIRAKRIEVESDRKSTRLNSSHVEISYAVFCLKKKSVYVGQLTQLQRDAGDSFLSNSLHLRLPPISTLFPYTTLFRSPGLDRPPP